MRLQFSDLPLIARKAQSLQDRHRDVIDSFRRILRALKASDVQHQEPAAQHKATAKGTRAQQAAAKWQ